VTGPFWFAFAGSGVFVILMWRQLTHITHDEAGHATVKHGERHAHNEGSIPSPG